MSHLIARRTGRSRDTGPGPSDYFRYESFGKNSPMWSIKGNQSPKEKKESGEFVSLGSTIGDAPKIRISGRYVKNAVGDLPGPCYAPKPFGEEAPAVRFCRPLKKRRVRNKSSDDGPGPGAYYPQKADLGPRFSIKARNMIPLVTSDTPGPSQYCPKIYSTIKAPPSPSIGRRVFMPTEKSDSPGPSSYSVPRELGGTKPRFHIWHKTFDADSSPGPAAYGPSAPPSKASTPRYTIGSRYEIKEDKNNNAGFVSIPSTVGEGPAIKMKSRPKYKEVSDTPGPNYVPPGLLSKETISRGVLNKRKRAKSPPDSYGGQRAAFMQRDIMTPGPGQYMIRSESKPGIKIKSRTFMPEEETTSPGPAAYSPKIAPVRKTIPSPVIGRRTTTKDGLTGAPYVALPSTLNGPKYSIGRIDPCEITVL